MLVHSVERPELSLCSKYRKKFMVAYLDMGDEIIICDFALQKMLKV